MKFKEFASEIEKQFFIETYIENNIDYKCANIKGETTMCKLLENNKADVAHR